MSRNWTEGQQDAICARGGTLLVSAAAGSGKTAVLVQRVIERITDTADPVDADRLLVVTFTKAAAAEMRGRISAELSRMLEKDPFNTHLQRQQLLLSHAHISTIDSFCSDLVKQNFYRLGISPEIRIAEDSEMTVLRSESAGETLEEFYEKGDPEYYAFAEAFSTGRDDAAIAETVGRLYDFVRSHPFPKRWLTEKADLYKNCMNAAQTVWGKAILSFAADAADYCILLTQDSLAAICEDEKIAEAYGDALHSDLSGLNFLRDAIRAGEWDKAFAFAENPSWHTLGRLRGDDPIKQRVQAARKTMKKTVDGIAKLFCAPEKQCREDIARLCPIVNMLFKVTLRFSEKLEEKKKERHSADFSDYEHWALQLLVRETENGFERTPEAEEISSLFAEVMVDEYQDTNETQDLIFRAVSQDEKNLFMVGDVKQSIYRFRQAMPQIFLRKRASFPLYDRKKDEYPACVILDRNFRSRAGVTDAVNFVFRQLMSRQAGELDYTKEEELVPQAAYPPCEEPSAELDVIDLSAEDPDGCNAIQAESRRIAERIFEIMDGKPRISENGALRPAIFRDFCILLRSANRPAHEYVRELTALGIPAWADTAGGFFEAYEVGIALSLLQIIDNPLQDIPLLSVMMSPVYGFTADDMAKIRIPKRFGRLYPAVSAAAKDGNEKAASFLEEIEHFRVLAAAMPSDRLIRTAFEETGLFQLVQAMPNGELRLANLRLLPEYAKKYEASGSSGLTGFLRFLDRVKTSSGDLSAAASLTESANVVRVMSIHRSKGLEFPVCILAGCSRQFHKEVESVLLHPEFGLGARLKEKSGIRYNTMPRQAIAQELERDGKSEELRVLYVAMTRAKEKLIAVVSLKNAEKTLSTLAADILPGKRISPYIVYSAKSISDWLLLCALRHPDGGCLRSMAGASQEIVVPAEESCSINLVQSQKETEKEDSEEIPQAKANPALEAEIVDNLSYVYPYAALRGVCAKAAVSELAAKPFSAQYAASSRPAFLSEKGLTPAERGTALHAYLQFADYRKAAADPQKELGRLIAEKYLTSAQAQAIDLSQAEAFFASPLMKRIANSPHFEREFRFSAEVPAGRVHPGLTPPMSEEKIFLQGAADLVFEENGGLVLVDFKTDHTKDARALWERYQEQLQLYRAELENCTGKKVNQCLLYSFYLNREITEDAI